MKKLIQTRLHKGIDDPKDRGNCFPTVLACLLDLESPEDCIQIQEHYDTADDKNDDWVKILDKWLLEKGYLIGVMLNHSYDDSFYMVTGDTERGNCHICIYQNGKLYHDPHPSGAGLISETLIEFLHPVDAKYLNLDEKYEVASKYLTSNCDDDDVQLKFCLEIFDSYEDKHLDDIVKFKTYIVEIAELKQKIRDLSFSPEISFDFRLNWIIGSFLPQLKFDDPEHICSFYRNEDCTGYSNCSCGKPYKKPTN